MCERPKQPLLTTWFELIDRFEMADCCIHHSSRCLFTITSCVQIERRCYSGRKARLVVDASSICYGCEFHWPTLLYRVTLRLSMPLGVSNQMGWSHCHQGSSMALEPLKHCKCSSGCGLQCHPPSNSPNSIHNFSSIIFHQYSFFMPTVLRTSRPLYRCMVRGL